MGVSIHPFGVNAMKKSLGKLTAISGLKFTPGNNTAGGITDALADMHCNVVIAALLLDAI